jgi:hypothetical protein
VVVTADHSRTTQIVSEHSEGLAVTRRVTRTTWRRSTGRRHL